MKRMSRWLLTSPCCLLMTLSPVQGQQDEFDMEALFGDVPAPAVTEAASTPADPAAVDELENMFENLPAAPAATGADDAAVVELGFEPDTPVAAVPAADVDDATRLQAAEQTSQQELVRLQAREKEGLIALDEGNGALQAGQFARAVDFYDEALGKLRPRPAAMPYIEMARKNKAEAYLRMAERLFERREAGGNLQQARDFITQAEAAYPGDVRGADLRSRIAKYERQVEVGIIERHLRDDEKYVSQDKAVSDLFKIGKQQFEVGDYDAAEATFEQILVEDRYNRDAMRFLRRIAEKKYDAHWDERKWATTKMMDEGLQRWLLPHAGTRVGAGSFQPKDEAPIQQEDAALEEKLRKIIIPEISFKRAQIGKVIDYLIQTSREVDKDGIGVNIIFMDPDLAGDAAPAAAPVDPGFGAGGFGGFGAPAAAPVASGGSIQPITLELRNVSMLDALKFVTDIAQLYFRYERNVVIIEKTGTGKVITRFYPVDPARFTTVTESMSRRGGLGGQDQNPFGAPANPFGGAGPAATGDGPDLKVLFQQYGVSFPPGTSISYEPLISQLIVTQTPDVFPKFEEVLAKINVSPSQVEIEARFVEVLQTDLEEVGFEWILTDDAEILVKDGPGPVGSKERIVAGADSSGVTSGIRFFDFNNVANATSPTSNSGANSFIGDILSIQGLLTNPELTFVVHALEQSGNSDLLSAPRVTTINGVNAVIEVVQELIYPTEFDVTENDITISGGATDTAGRPVFIPPTVIPGGFETREVGVILNVTPTVNPDNYTINLVMLPEIAELVDWIQYGTQIPVGNGESVVVNMPQPVFASRNVSTTMIVWDGHTVVMGGLIRENLVEFNDKVPILGDIPLLGALFRSEGKRSEKRNLLIFVTARLVDPSGNPINRGDKTDLIQNRSIGGGNPGGLSMAP